MRKNEMYKSPRKKNHRINKRNMYLGPKQRNGDVYLCIFSLTRGEFLPLPDIKWRQYTNQVFMKWHLQRAIGVMSAWYRSLNHLQDRTDMHWWPTCPVNQEMQYLVLLAMGRHGSPSAWVMSCRECGAGVERRLRQGTRWSKATVK